VNVEREDLDQATRDNARARELGPPEAVDAWRRHESFDLLSQRRFREALVFLDGSLPDVAGYPDTLFLRALALAQLGQLDEAVVALKKAVDHGFRDVNRLKNAEELNPLRGRDDFKRVVAGLVGNK
jgi:hypothetical protein